MKKFQKILFIYKIKKKIIYQNVYKNLIEVKCFFLCKYCFENNYPILVLLNCFQFQTIIYRDPIFLFHIMKEDGNCI